MLIRHTSSGDFGAAAMDQCCAVGREEFVQHRASLLVRQGKSVRYRTSRVTLIVSFRTDIGGAFRSTGCMSGMSSSHRRSQSYTVFLIEQHPHIGVKVVDALRSTR